MKAGSSATRRCVWPTCRRLHVAPPPANQIVHVLLARPTKDLHMMTAVRVTGTLHALPSDTDLGASGWQMRAPAVEPYASPPPR